MVLGVKGELWTSDRFFQICLTVVEDANQRDGLHYLLSFRVTTPNSTKTQILSDKR